MGIKRLIPTADLARFSESGENSFTQKYSREKCADKGVMAQKSKERDDQRLSELAQPDVAVSDEAIEAALDALVWGRSPAARRFQSEVFSDVADEHRKSIEATRQAARRSSRMAQQCCAAGIVALLAAAGLGVGTTPTSPVVIAVAGAGSALQVLAAVQCRVYKAANECLVRLHEAHRAAVRELVLLAETAKLDSKDRARAVRAAMSRLAPNPASTVPP